MNKHDITSKYDWMPNNIRIEKTSNKIFPLLIKKENAAKPHFGPDLGLLGPNLS